MSKRTDTKEEMLDIHEQDKKLKLIKDIVAWQAMRLQYGGVLMNKTQIDANYQYLLTKTIQRLQEIYEALREWIDENYPYQSGSENEDEIYRPFARGNERWRSRNT